MPEQFTEEDSDLTSMPVPLAYIEFDEQHRLGITWKWAYMNRYGEPGQAENAYD